MCVLVPDDPAFAARFFAMEDPLLHSLYHFYLNDLAPEYAERVRSAYGSWGNIDGMLPQVLRNWQPAFQGEPKQEPDITYVLHGPSGQLLTSLYAIDVSESDLRELRTFHTLLASAEDDGRGALAHAIRDIAQHHDSIVENFRRALAVLELRAAPQLLESLRRAAPAGPVIAISLDVIQEKMYRALYGNIVSALSAGDRWAYDIHRTLYS